jgi:general secretion pathway protein G
MIIPTRLLRSSRRHRLRARERIRREAERIRASRHVPSGRIVQGPAAVFGILVIMLVLGGLFVARLRVRPARGRDPAIKARRDLYALRVAVERFRLDCGRYPASAEGLKALVLDPPAPGWRGPYVNLVRPDPWRRPYLYAVTGGAVDVRSAGPDGRPYTADDIGSPAPAAADLEGWAGDETPPGPGLTP